MPSRGVYILADAKNTHNLAEEVPTGQFGRVILDGQHETRHGFADLAGEAALPHGWAMERSDCRGDFRLPGGGGGGANSGDGERSVEVLSDLGNYPITHGPSVNPVDVSGLIPALDENGGSECGDGFGDENERVFVSAGQEAHQKLVRRRTMEPPL
ncbi:OLC1v1026923C1 [Oldenlandia corymbosa var. corymbosa]|uniref:OLC1v1026923C1 n=1 Tax=Oldenlandia corymbosa var. corymbosa TaxID=529605 RepID=A0AAV1C9Z7_OLDCO|nr:OLC1v1026923C1 [Oldenlandia corymbosa var. corymbosa]